MMARAIIKHFSFNTAGQDWAVGDIHGHFTLLQAALDRIGFNPAVDRLFCPGDLIDRGPESDQVQDWLAKPWFHASQGNHEEMTISHVNAGTVSAEYMADYVGNGGAWFLGMTNAEQRGFALDLAALPLLMEVETRHGLVGLVHADCPLMTWAKLKDYLLNTRNPPTSRFMMSVEDACKWSYKRIRAQDESGVPDLRALICGHKQLEKPVVLGNVYHIDTRGFLPDKGGFFTLLNLNTLEAVPPIPPKLQWGE